MRVQKIKPRTIENKAISAYTGPNMTEANAT